MRIKLLLLAALLTPLFAQTVAFDVASVRPTKHGRDAKGYSQSSADIPSPGRFLAQNSSLDELIRFAYDLKDDQVVGPEWLNHDEVCFDIEAKAPPETSKKQVRAMLQELLRDRFKMVSHKETRMLPTLLLTAAKSGPKLKPSAQDGQQSWSATGSDITAVHMTMNEFAYQLSLELKHPVLDQTGISGAFDFQIKANVPGGREEQDAALIAAIRNNLGLTLQSGKGPIEVLVVEKIERSPTDN